MLRYGPMARGHDTLEHINYARHFTDQFWSGELYPRWLIGMNHGLGSASFFVFPPLPFYVYALAEPGAKLLRWNAMSLTAFLALWGVRFVRFCLASREVQAKRRFGLRRLTNTWEIKPITDLEDSSSGTFAKCQQHGQRFLGARKEHNRPIQYRQGDEALRSNRAGEDHVKARRFAEIIANDSKSGYVDSGSFKPKSFLLVIRM